jgi:hypothetical protein
MASHMTPAICCGPTGNLQGSYFFISLVTGLLIKRCKWSELPVPDAVIERVAYFADKSGSSPGIVFSNQHCQQYDWPDNDIVGSDDTLMAIYPDIRADILGVQLAHPIASPPLHHDSPHDDFDWAQMADEALANADINDTEALPPPPEVIVIDDGNNVPLPPSIKQTLAYLLKIEPDAPSQFFPTPQSPTSQLPVHPYPPHQQTQPQPFADYHLFTTVAEDVTTLYPFINVSGNTVDLAITDEQHIAHVCHYVMLHCAESTFVGNPNNKKQYGLKAGLGKFAERGNDALMKELRQFHVLRCFSSKDPKTLS